MATFKAPTVKSTGTPKYSPPKLPAPKVTKGVYDPSAFSYAPGNRTPGVPRPGATPAGTPAAPASPTAGAGPAALPPDATYEQIIGAAGRRRDTTLSQLAGDRTRTLLDYGFNENAATGALSYDPNNPESKAAQLKKHYDQSRAGAGVNMAARGQLYAGSYQNAQDTLNAGQLTDEDRLNKAITNYLAGNTGAKATAQTDYEFAAGQAYGDRVARVPQNPLYSPTTPDAAAPAAAQPNPLIPGQPLSTGFAGLDPSKRYRQASNGRLQIQNSNGTWRYV